LRQRENSGENIGVILKTLEKKLRHSEKGRKSCVNEKTTDKQLRQCENSGENTYLRHSENREGNKSCFSMFQN
jgi:hypothetical protein